MTLLALPADVARASPPAWFPWAGASMGAFLGLVGLVWLLRTVPRLRRARTTSGVVVRADRDHANQGQFLWRLVVEYRDEQGQVRQGRWAGQSSLDRTVYVPGTPVPVRYDPVSGVVVDLPGGYRPHALLVPAGLLVIGPLVGTMFWFITS